MSDQPKAKWKRSRAGGSWDADVGPYELWCTEASGDWIINEQPSSTPHAFNAYGSVDTPCDTVTLMLAAESALADHLRAVADTMTWPEEERLPAFYDDNREASVDPSMDSSALGACPMIRERVGDRCAACGSYQARGADGHYADCTWLPKPSCDGVPLFNVATDVGSYNNLPSAKVFGVDDFRDTVHAMEEFAKGYAPPLVHAPRSHNPLCRHPCSEIACDVYQWRSYGPYAANAQTADGYCLGIDISRGKYQVTRNGSIAADFTSPAFVNDGCSLAREASDAYARAVVRIARLNDCGYVPNTKENS